MRLFIVPLILLLACAVPAAAQTCSDLPSDPCALDPVFAHAVTVEEAGLRFTFASTSEEYVAGDTIDFVILIENVGTAYTCVNFGQQPIDAIFALPQGCTDLSDPCAEDRPWSEPSTVFFAAGEGIGLDPGACRLYAHTWDTSVDVAEPGIYDMTAGLFEVDPDGFAFQLPAGGVALPIEILASIPVDEESTGMLKARFH